jgi:SAM-dependent methyltransferase
VDVQKTGAWAVLPVEGVVVVIPLHYDILVPNSATGSTRAIRGSRLLSKANKAPRIVATVTAHPSAAPKRFAELISGRYRNDGRETVRLTMSQRAERNRLITDAANGGLIYESVDACPLCRETSQPVITCKDCYGLPFQMTCCPGCGLVYAVERLNTASLARFYSEFYRNLYEPDIGQDTLGTRFVEVRAIMSRTSGQIIETLGLSPDTDIIAEIGAGGGWNLVPFADREFRTVGFDYDPRLLELGRAHGIEMHDLGQASAPSVLDRQVSLLLAHEVLEHVPDPFAFLVELNTMLRPGGYLYLTVPPLDDIPFGYAGGDPLQEFQLAHLTLFDGKTLEAFLDISGFRILSPRPDLRLIAQKVGAPARRSRAIPGNHRRNMRRLAFAELMGRHIWSGIYRLCGHNYQTYMRITKVVGSILSAKRRRTVIERKLRTGI